MNMSPTLIAFVCLFAVSPALAQGIRGVTRRTPTVVYGQNASQFFAAGGLPLNPVNPALANVPGASQNGAMGGRGFVASPVPVARPGVVPGTTLSPVGRPAPVAVPGGSLPSGPASSPAANTPRR